MMNKELSDMEALKDTTDPKTLMEAFELFNQVSSNLTESYEKLKEEANELKIEVAQKNEELKRNLAENETLRNYLENIIQSISSGMIVIDIDGNITLVNQNAERIIGTTKKKLIGNNYNVLFQNLLSIQKLKETISKSAPFELEFPYTNQKKEKFILGVTVSSIYNEKKQIDGYIIDFRDLKNIKALEEKAGRVTRLTAMGEMAAKMAHEIRNPLGSIELFASLLKKQLADKPEKVEIAENIISGVKNLNRTVTNILHFSRPADPEINEIEIEKLLENLVSFMIQKIPKNINVITKFGKKRYPTEGDSELLKQMFSNIILNGIQSMPEGGTLTVKTSYRKALKNRSAKYYQNKSKIKIPCSFLKINIADTGIGIDKENLNVVFQPFFTTRNRGTGLGLSIIEKIIQQHNGYINIKSKSGTGTLVSVELPIYE